jgi:hypothetical protein
VSFRFLLLPLAHLPSWRDIAQSSRGFWIRLPEVVKASEGTLMTTFCTPDHVHHVDHHVYHVYRVDVVYPKFGCGKARTVDQVRSTNKKSPV